jgi:hypothetical protein
VGAGVEAAAAPLVSATSVSQNLSYVMWTAMTGGALSGAGTSGLMYDIDHGRDFTAEGFFQAMGVGAFTGMVGGALGGLGSMPASVGLTQGMSVTASLLTRLGMRAALGMVGKDVSSLLTSACMGKKVTVGDMLLSSASGFASGALSGISSGLQAAGRLPASASIESFEDLVVRAGTGLNKAIAKAEEVATSELAIASYVTGGVLLVGGYGLWAGGGFTNNAWRIPPK